MCNRQGDVDMCCVSVFPVYQFYVLMGYVAATTCMLVQDAFGSHAGYLVGKRAFMLCRSMLNLCCVNVGYTITRYAMLCRAVWNSTGLVLCCVRLGVARFG